MLCKVAGTPSPLPTRCYQASNKRCGGPLSLLHDHVHVGVILCSGPASHMTSHRRRYFVTPSMRLASHKMPPSLLVCPLVVLAAVAWACISPSGRLPGAWGVLSDAVGLTYTAAWSYSFYPQILLNWRMRCASQRSRYVMSMIRCWSQVPSP
jgi:PQ loop repeat